jgi:phage-related protein
MLTFTNLNLVPGQVLRIDTEQRTATVDGVNVLHRLAVGSKWFDLKSGDNELEITGPGDVAVKVLWRDRYL